MQSAFDPRQKFAVTLHDFGPIQVSRPDKDGRWTTTEERQLAMSVLVNGSEVIDAGLVLTATDELIAFNPCGSCELWECNLTEGWAAKVRRFGPYIFWIRPSGDIYLFGIDGYRKALGPGADTLPELTSDDAWELYDPERENRYPGVDGSILLVDPERAPEGPFVALYDWPAYGLREIQPVDPPREAIEVPALNEGGDSIWIARKPGADGLRAGYFPGITRANVWCTGPVVEMAVAALVGPMQKEVTSG